MKRLNLSGSLATCLCLSLAGPLLAAETSATVTTTETSIAAAAPADKCLSDLRSFNSKLQTDGYWLGGYTGSDPELGGSGYGYGYPLGGYGVGYDGSPEQMGETGTSYFNLRSGYEIRMLLAAADILARHGRQQACDDVLATTREHYKQYVVDMQDAGMPMANVPGWQQQQVAIAMPVADATTSFRFDQLLGADVRNSKYEALGSVDDLVMSPQTGKIAYVLIARGGWIFGVGEKYVPIPWEAFKVTPNVTLLVLDTTLSAMDAAPQVNADEFTSLEQQSEEVDAYWNSLIPSVASN